ncbi:MAG: DUF4292 domain-containing protein [Muribaculaceae bacterium]|nr:DUF4292 domain-containing protein [Muribaculaceae bacterium]
MLKNKFKYAKPVMMIAALLFSAVFCTVPAEAKKKKKEKKQEVIETPALIEEEEAAVEEIGFDPDSLYFAEVDPDAIRQEVLNAVLPNYNQWHTAMLNGKLRLKGLPLSPSIKIFMENGKKISISVRVAIMGEVGRIEVSGDTLLAVNKMKRTYCMESFENLKNDYPGVIGDVQSLLLGRVVIFQAGELSAETSEAVDFSVGDAYNEACSWYIDFPKNRTESDDLGYQYTINSDGLISKMLALLITSDHDFSLNLDYTYSSHGRDLEITFSKDGKPKFNTQVVFDSVQWEASPIAPVSINASYTRLGITDFIKSFKL